LDFGVDGAAGLASTNGPGALVGLPATLTNRDSSMTATVTDDAELGFLTAEALQSLLRERPEFCQELLVILGEKLAQTEQGKAPVLRKQETPQQESGGT
jgi:CRP-like cAMP-binding protein